MLRNRPTGIIHFKAFKDRPFTEFGINTTQKRFILPSQILVKIRIFPHLF